MGNQIKQNQFRLPAEWEIQSGIMLIFPHKGTDWAPYLEEITKTYLQLIEAITRYEKLLIVAQDIEHVKCLVAENIAHGHENIIYRQCENNDTWARDVAPITVVANEEATNKTTKFHLLDFCFNGWGEKFAAEKDNAINSQLYFSHTFNGSLENHKDFVLEGGSIESDGEATLFTTTACLTAPHRNQPLEKDDIEKRLLLLFPHLKRVVWIEHGELIGDDTDGHIDTILRCAPNNTLLYISTDDPTDPHFEDLQALDRQARALRTLNGQPYRCLKLPLPKAIYDGDERLPATYANFLILNEAVIVPTYNQPDSDQLAIQTIAEAFQGYDIISIDSSTIVRQHGSIHCLTMQFPKGVLI